MKLNISFLFYLLLPLLLMVSFLSTSYGVLSYITNVDSIKSIDFTNIKVIVSIAIVLTITLFAYISLDRLLNTSSVLAKILIFIFYLFITAISIGFGYPFWWNNLIANNTLNNKIALTTDKGLNNIKNIENSLYYSKQYTQRVLDISNKKKRFEEDRGGSCDGISSPPRFWKIS